MYFTVTFHQFNASLQSTDINSSFKKNIQLTPNILMVVYNISCLTGVYIAYWLKYQTHNVPVSQTLENGANNSVVQMIKCILWMLW